jgi:mannose-1-phosphate guanylyltransferase
MIILPADHAVTDESKLRETLAAAVDLAVGKDLLVTVGIKPDGPNTAYGYIQSGSQLQGRGCKIRHFYEKPSLVRAKQYFEAGDYYWNSGMFIWRADVLLRAIEQYLPALHEGLMEIDRAIGGPQEREVLERVFPNLEGISIDFGVMEHARNCAVIVAEPFGWNDVGSWDAWSDHFSKDSDGNLVHGQAVVLESKGCVVHSEQKLTAILGADDLIVINGPDALLICPRERAQDVKKIVDRLKSLGRNDLV